MSSEEEDLLKLFAYGETERRIFPYINEYMETIENWLTDHEMNNEQLFRYMVMGLFLEYRATNHQGGTFNTVLENWSDLDKRPDTRDKLVQFNKRYNKEILSTSEYLGLISKVAFDKWTGIAFSDFVVNG